MTREYAQAVVGLAIILVVGWSVVTSAALNPDMSEFVRESGEWCDQHDGDLYNAQTLGSHGGLHCELPNGTNVEMDEVIPHAE